MVSEGRFGLEACVCPNVLVRYSRIIRGLNANRTSEKPIELAVNLFKLLVCEGEGI